MIMTDIAKINPSSVRLVCLFPYKTLTSFYPSKLTLSNIKAIYILEGAGEGCVYGGGRSPIINNNNKALCFVRMRWEEVSEAKCTGNPPLMTAHRREAASFKRADRAQQLQGL